MVTHEKHIDAYDQMFLYGNRIVIGKYFKQQVRSPYSYIQCDRGEAYIYSHLIRAMKFQMRQNSRRQKGSEPMYQFFKTSLLEIQSIVEIVEDE